MMMRTGRQSATGWEVASLRLSTIMLGVSILWVYNSTIICMRQRWSIDPRYSHGYLVPIFATVLLCRRLRIIRQSPVPGWARWFGVVLIGLGMSVHVAGARFFVNWLEAAALLPILAGVSLLLGGWTGLRCAWPSIFFLLFMIPLPFRLEVALGAPLQRTAAISSACVLQLLGQPAIVEGNIIALRSSRLGVVEACNGLGMLVTFTAMAVAVALIIERPWMDRLVLIMSAVPISFLSNVFRITATGLLEELVGHEFAGWVYHDIAGWLMMPIALILLWIEVKIMSYLIVDNELIIN